MPIIKIDEPYFDYICNIQQLQTILFTNPATVEGTVERLKHYADNHQKSINIEVIVIKNTFDLIMRGLKRIIQFEYIKSVFIRFFSEHALSFVCLFIKVISINLIKHTYAPKQNYH